MAEHVSGNQAANSRWQTATALAVLVAAICCTAALYAAVFIPSRAAVPRVSLNVLAACLAAVGLAWGLRRLGFTASLAAALVLSAVLLPRRYSDALTPGGREGPADFMALLTLAVVVAVVASWVRHRPAGQQATGIEWPAGIMFALALITAIRLSDQYAVPRFLYHGLADIFLPLLLVPLWANAGWRLRQVDQVILLTMLSGVVAAVLGLMLVFTLWRLFGAAGLALFGQLGDVLTRTRAPVGGSGPTGLLMLMLLPMVLVYLLHARSRLAAALWALAAALMAGGILLSVSRTVVAASPLVLLALLYWTRRQVRLRAPALAAAVAVVVLTVVVLGSTYGATHRSLRRLTQMHVTETASDRMRVISLRVALDLAENHPWLGGGIGRHYPRQLLARFVYLHDEPVVLNPHNLYVQSLVEQGILGTVAYLAVLLVPLVTLLRGRGQAGPPFIRDRLAAVAAGMLALLLYSLTSSSLSVMLRLGIIYWSYVGFGYALLRAGQRETPVV